MKLSNFSLVQKLTMYNKKAKNYPNFFENCAFYGLDMEPEPKPEPKPYKNFRAHYVPLRTAP
jgi:hypothetical protein